MLFERVGLMRLLYERLPEAQKHIHNNKVVESLEDNGNEVMLTCADGTAYKGDIVVGADGVGSIVRRLMFPEDRISPYTSTYRCLYGCGPRLDGMEVGDMIESHSSEGLFQVLIGDDMAFWFLFERLPSTTRDWTSYSDEEVERFAAKHGNMPITEGGHVHFRDVWESRKRAKLANIEEGIAKTWSKGRTVLLGDSCHKMTPNLALGANNGIESGVVLVNLLHASLQQNSGRPLTTQQIQKVFDAYQGERYNSAWWSMNLTGFYTRMAAWSNVFFQLVVKYVNPRLGDDGVADYLLGPIVRNGHVLEFAKEEAFASGKMPWKYGKVDYID
jgi:2-polyprenyl-6-methoxyphenol hydroxylase-like FAD-dependent oxidoreductase